MYEVTEKIINYLISEETASVAKTMLNAGESADKIMVYLGISKQKLAELKREFL